MTSGIYQEETETLVETDDGQSEPQEKGLNSLKKHQIGSFVSFTVL